MNEAGRTLEADRLPPDDHRPWPMPVDPWVMTQTWQSALFAHWRFPPSTLRRLVPQGLTLETFQGQAWLGITAFLVTGARLRGLPAIPGLSTFAEVNVRTYVQLGSTPGVLFLSLDAASAIAVLGGRSWYRLPYFLADARVDCRDQHVHFESRRDHPDAPAAAFVADYRGIGAVQAPADDRLVRWLTERYCLYAAADGAVLRGEIHHQPWPIQRAETTIVRNTLAGPLGLTLEGPPTLAHFSAGVDAVIWPPRAVTEQSTSRDPGAGRAPTELEDARRRTPASHAKDTAA